jgi:sulfotransferase family protein
MTLRLPDFIIGGAPRSGTTWLANALDRHPQIWLAKPFRPEPKHFLVDELYAEGLDAYSRRWFADAPDVTAVGEKSTNYLESPAAAARIARDLPRVRLVFVLRDPAARALSNYRWSVMNGMEHEDFATALELEQRREEELAPELRYARPHAYFSRGRYARMLRPYYDLFPAAQILALRFEDLVQCSAPTLSRAHEFLGVEPMPDLVGRLEAVNASNGAGDADLRTLARLRTAYAPLNAELAELVGADFVPWTDEGVDP